MNILQPKTDRHPTTHRWLNGCALALFCLSVAGLAIVGLPLPDGNDLFWLGPAIGLLKTGQLINPYTQASISGFSVKYFYVQGPVYFYVLAAWFCIFGVSTVSITVIHWIFCISAAILLILFFRRAGIDIYIGFLAAIISAERYA